MLLILMAENIIAVAISSFKSTNKAFSTWWLRTISPRQNDCIPFSDICHQIYCDQDLMASDCVCVNPCVCKVLLLEQFQPFLRFSIHTWNISTQNTILLSYENTGQYIRPIIIVFACCPQRIFFT